MRTDSPTLSQQAIDGGAQPGDQALRRRDRSREAARLHGQVARTRRRRTRRSARRARRSARRPSCRSVLRGNDFKLYDLIWKRTVASQMADAQGLDGVRHHRRGRPPRRHGTAEFTAIRHRHHLPRLPAAYEEGHDEERNEHDAEPDEQRKLPPLTVGQVLDAADGRGQGPRDQPAAALHRGEPGQDARRAGHRPPVDLREHHLDDHRPRLRHPARPGARAELDRVQRRPPARGVLRATWSNTTSPPRWRTTSTASPAARPTGSTGSTASTSAATSTAACAPSSTTSATSTRARSTRSRIADDITLRIGKYGPYLEVRRAADAETAAPRQHARGPGPRRADRREGAGTHRRTRRRRPRLGVNPTTGKTIVAKDGRYGPYVTELEPEPEVARSRSPQPIEPSSTRRPASVDDRRSPRRSRAKKAAGAQAAHRIPLQVDGPGDRRPRDRARAARPAARRRARPRDRATRSPRRTAATVRTSRRAPTRRSLDERRADLRHRPARRARGLRPAEVRRAARLERAQGVRRRPGERQADPGHATAASAPYVTDGVTNATIPRGEDVEDDRLRPRRAAARRQAREGPGEAEGEAAARKPPPSAPRRRRSSRMRRACSSPSRAATGRASRRSRRCSTSG